MSLSEAVPPLSAVPSTPSPEQSAPDKRQDDLRHQLLEQCDAMARYAFASGLTMSSELLRDLAMLEQEMKGAPETSSLAVIGSVHAQLATVVAPATPKTIHLLHREQFRSSWLSLLGPVPTVRRLMLTAAFFTLVFVLSSLSPYISVPSMNLDIYRMDGLVLLNVLVFLMSAAGLGACFHALFIIHSYIAEGTYDPRYDSSYWTRIGLGIISGMVLSQLIPIGPDISSEGMMALEEVLKAQLEGKSTTQMLAQMGDFNPSLISKPVLALLGGFSATLVYNVLQRLVDAVESLFKGKVPDKPSGGAASTGGGTTGSGGAVIPMVTPK